MIPSLTLVLGGASSGKSDFAERLVAASGLPRIYIATAEAHDAEMAEKIARHRESRGTAWHSIDAPHDAAGAVAAIPEGRAVLLDCATMWLSNRLLAGAEVAAEVPALLDALAACASPVVVVSNEVGQGVVPDSALGRRFRDLQGMFNRQLAERADLVVAVIAGLPLALKGQFPAEIR